MPTFGRALAAPTHEENELLAGVGDAIDAVAGRFTMRYTTIAIATVKTALHSRNPKRQCWHPYPT